MNGDDDAFQCLREFIRTPLGREAPAGTVLEMFSADGNNEPHDVAMRFTDDPDQREAFQHMVMFCRTDYGRNVPIGAIVDLMTSDPPPQRARSQSRKPDTPPTIAPQCLGEFGEDLQDFMKLNTASGIPFTHSTLRQHFRHAQQAIVEAASPDQPPYTLETLLNLSPMIRYVPYDDVCVSWCNYNAFPSQEPVPYDGQCEEEASHQAAA